MPRHLFVLVALSFAITLVSGFVYATGCTTPDQSSGGGPPLQHGSEVGEPEPNEPESDEQEPPSEASPEVTEDDDAQEEIEPTREELTAASRALRAPGDAHKEKLRPCFEPLFDEHPTETYAAVTTFERQSDGSMDAVETLVEPANESASSCFAAVAGKIARKSAPEMPEVFEQIRVGATMILPEARYADLPDWDGDSRPPDCPGEESVSADLETYARGDVTGESVIHECLLVAGRAYMNDRVDFPFSDTRIELRQSPDGNVEVFHVSAPPDSRLGECLLWGAEYFMWDELPPVEETVCQSNVWSDRTTVQDSFRPQTPPMYYTSFGSLEP